MASKLAVEAAVKAVERGGSLADALQAANVAVGEGGKGKPELEGMGTTVVVALVKADDVQWISVGDSPFYLISNGSPVRLNADHSMAPQIDALYARGLLTAEEAATHPGRHTLREAVMGQPLSLIDQGSRRLEPDARLLLCSDGVHSVPDDAIAAHASRPVQELIATVLAAGVAHQDNVTVIKLEREP